MILLIPFVIDFKTFPIILLYKILKLNEICKQNCIKNKMNIKTKSILRYNLKGYR
jgi:hypothetical protein